MRPPKTTDRKTLLLMDDDLDFCNLQQSILSKKGYHVVSSAHPNQILDLVAHHKPLSVLLDLNLGTEDGMKVLDTLQAHHPELPVIILTGHPGIKHAVEAMKRGAHGYIQKPIDQEELGVLLGKALRQRDLVAEVTSMKERIGEAGQLEDLMGSSEVILNVIRLVRAVSGTDVNVLLIGESGTGKELVARAIHQLSRRRTGPYVPIDCAAIPETLIESELFGHEKGAFTGAYETTKGKFEVADGGTVFLDELTNIPLPVQAKLLRFLETHQLERVGGRKTIKTSVRIVGASNTHLPEICDKGLFRRDLFYRLNEFPIELPPLRTRKVDIPLLCNLFLRELQPEVGRAVSQITPQALARLATYDFPGNVRELRNILKRAMVIAKDRIEAHDLPLTAASGPTPNTPPNKLTLHAATQQMTGDLERQMIVEALKTTHGHQGKAATLLGVSPKTLYNKMRSYKIEN